MVIKAGGKFYTIKSSLHTTHYVFDAQINIGVVAFQNLHKFNIQSISFKAKN
jgi:hypothetical protein